MAGAAPHSHQRKRPLPGLTDLRHLRAAARLLAAFTVTCSVMLFSPASAKTEEKPAPDLNARLANLSEPVLKDLFNFVAGNTLFALFHEGGHMLVSEFDLPKAKQSEETVDMLTTVSMLANDSEDMNSYLSNAMIGWFLLSEHDTGGIAFFRSHGLNLERGMRTLCLMAGSDEEAFMDLATDLGLPADRGEACANAFDQTSLSWETLVGNHLNGDNMPPPQISVSYDEPPADLHALGVFLKESGLMELAAQTFINVYTLPHPIRFSAKSCSEKNAYWDPALREVSICYELMEGYTNAFLGVIASAN